MMTNMLTPLLPVWEEGSVKDYGEIPCNLGGGPLTIRCKYGNILKNPSNAIYYKCNMESSGVELRSTKFGVRLSKATENRQTAEWNRTLL